MRTLTIIGNLGKDAQIAEIGGYTAIQFSVATTERHKDKTGVWGELTSWTNCSYFGKREHLEKLLPNLKKGKKVYFQATFTLSVYKEQPQVSALVQNLQLC